MHRLLLLGAVLLLPTLGWAQSQPAQLARQYLQQHAKAYGVTGTTAQDARLTDAYTSRHNGVTHLYFRQQLDGLDVIGTEVNVNVTRDGRVLLAGGSFVPGLEAAARGAAPSLSAAAAVEEAARHLGLSLTAPLSVQRQAGGAARETVLSEAGIAREPIPARLVYVLDEMRAPRLAWTLRINEAERPHVWAVDVDAATGAVLRQRDMVVHDHWATPEGAAAPIDLAPRAAEPGWHPPMAYPAGASAVYNVFAAPVESPSHGERSLLADPADLAASPLGWHDTGDDQYTITRGNNVYAYVDADDIDAPSGDNAVPDGGEDLVFDFELDLALNPAQYRPAAVTNLFYWNNVIHDVFYRYGFDEAAGNFQVTNFSGEGLGNDAVRAQAQDGSETCNSWWGCFNNANFYTPSDGQPPRMQMYVWDQSTPYRDGDFDAGIVTHEYGHGISNRLTGGPSNVECLDNSEQMGEGWSDYLGLMLTMREGDTAEQRRGVGTYALGEPTTGNGIRPAPYSTDFAINGYTYGNLGSLAVPHGVGFAWATMLWDMTWELIDVYGFDPDVVGGSGGNNLALQLVMDGMKLQPCSPGFVDGRDAILAADTALTGGANALYIWRAFAKRGLGYSASQGSSSSASDGTEAFDMPPGLRRHLALEATPAPVPNGELVTFTLAFENGAGLEPLRDVALSSAVPENALYVPGSATDGGRLESGRVVFPAFDADAGTLVTRSFMALVTADGETVVYFTDDMEDGDAHWETTHGVGSADWSLGDGYDGSAGWFAANVGAVSDQYLTLAEPVTLTGPAELRFQHRYDTENGFDGGVIEISTDGGSTWEDLGDHITENGYTGTISTSWSNPLGGRPAFEGDSGGWIQTVVDLTAFAGQEVLVRFRMATDVSVSANGWYVDDIAITSTPMMVLAEACAEGADVECATAHALVAESLEGTPRLEIAADEIVVSAEAGGTSTAELTLGNTGDRALDAYLGSDSGWLVGAFVTVEPEDEGTARLTFDATGMSSGTHTDTLTVVTNDPAQPVVTIPVQFTVGAATAGESEAEALGTTHRLSGVYPNPLTSTARLALEVAQAQHVTVALYDVTGREVARLHEGALAAGTRHEVVLDGRGLAAGVYLVRVTGEAFTETTRVTILH